MDIFSTSFPELSDPAIGKLNDEFRETLQGGRVVYTGGVHALGEEKVSAVLEMRHRQLDGCGREKLGGEVEAAVRPPRQRR